MSGQTFSIRGYSVFFVLSLAALAAMGMPVATADADTHAKPGMRSGVRTKDSPNIFDALRTKPGCCGRRPNASTFSFLESTEYESYKLTATYYKLDGNLTTTLMLNNKGPEPILATPTFYGLNGTRLDLAPITVPAASYIDVDMGELLREAGAGFREGSLELVYQAGEFQLGAQVKMVDAEKSLIWAEQLVYTSKFTSNRLEGVWWLPNEDANARLAVSNTRPSAVTVGIAVDGTFPRQAHPIQIQLGPNETRVLDVLRDLVTATSATFSKGGGISIEHTGAPGAILARVFISKPEQGFSAAVNLTDPELSASRKWHGSGLRLRNLDGKPLRPILAVRNTSSESTQFRGRIPYTMPDGEVAFADIPETRIEANSTKIVRLNRIIDNANIPASIGYAGIELEYDSPPGSIITSVQSVSEDGSHVFEVPMADPGNLPASAGGFPWKADGDFRTLVYIKNETDVPRRYIAHLAHDGGQYSLGIKEIKPGETVAIDFRELRDSQTPDPMGHIIPLSANKGQIAWSVKGMENKVLTGRSEQISLTNGVASTYACNNCCPDSAYQMWLDPSWIQLEFGGTAFLGPLQTDINCYSTMFGPYTPSPVFWSSDNVNVVSVFDGELITEGVGTANISATWETVLWWLLDGSCDPVYNQTIQYAPVEVTDPQPTISEVGIVEKNGLKSVNISISGAGGQDTTIFRLRLTAGSGIATFEDGSTQKSYTGNLAQTELKIKGVTESSAANNYVMEAVVNQTIDQSSARVFTVAAITALAFERINTTGTGNVPDVALDDNPGTDGTHTAEEGQRIFPDKNWHQDTTDRATLRVRATVTPANVPNLRVYFASFDLDDPSADAAPIDTNGANGVDNNGAVNGSKSGEFSNAAGVMCANAMAGTSTNLHVSTIDCPVTGSTTAANFRVTMQPGDNFAIAASLDGAYRDEIRVNTAAGSNLINTADQIIPISGQTNPNNVRGIRTKMLTVWRRLNIEVDSMGTVTGNSVIGMFGSSQTIAAGGSTNLTVIVNPALEVNRFENGRLVVTSVNPQRSFNVIDHTPTVTANTTNSVTVVNTGEALNITPADTFVLYDDDDFNDDDAVALNGDADDEIDEPDLGLLNESDDPAVNVFAPAYVRPRYDIGGANTAVTTTLNVVSNPQASDISGLFEFDRFDKHQSQDFWTIYLLGGYQFTIERDGDPMQFDAAGLILTVYGVADVPERMRTGQGAIIFLEDGRANEYPTGPVVSRASTAAHEVGHLFGCIHNDGELMAPSAIRTSNTLSNICKEWIRKAPNP